MRGPSWYMESVWSDLPSDLLEKVLTFLPIASLCRFRTVAKKWNRLISDPDFAARHARASSPEEYVLITIRCDFPLNSIGWQVLDVANKRFFTLSDDFLYKYVKQMPAALVSTKWSLRNLVAADGGLFCVLYTLALNAESVCPVYLVCNPVLRTVKQLPHVAGLVDNSQMVVMSTDRVSMEYEIFVINHADDQYHPNAVLVYESKTGTWRTASTVPQDLNSMFEQRLHYPVSSLMKNEFYKLFLYSEGYESGIFSYDKVTGVISDLGFDLPISIQHNPQLVVSKDRLFCVTLEGTVKYNPSIEIFEIILARKECVSLTDMPTELQDWIFGYDLLDTGALDGVLEDPAEPFVATGCADSILICSWTGRSVAYSFSNKSWHYFPDNKLLEAHTHYGSDDQEFHASHYCLSLCAP